MKILHIIPALARGGGERVAIDLANHSASKGHSVTLLTAIHVTGHQLAEKVSPKVKIRCLAPHSRSLWAAALRLIPWLFANRQWLLRHDIVHCHMSFGTLFGALLQGIRPRPATPVVVETYHAVGMPIPKWRLWVDHLLLSRRDAVAFVANDPKWSRHLQSDGGRLRTIILNGVAAPATASREAVERFRSERTRIPIKRGAVVGTVGRLAAHRRPDLLFDAFVHLSRLRGSDIHFLLAGEGPMRPEIHQKAEEMGLGDRVHLPGLILDAAEPFGLIDLYLTVNVGPVTGVAALEAALSGLPVLAVQLRKHYQASEEDWIWSSADPEEVAARAAEFLADPKARKALAARQAAHAAAHHSVEAMASRYCEFYEQARQERRKRVG